MGYLLFKNSPFTVVYIQNRDSISGQGSASWKQTRCSILYKEALLVSSHKLFAFFTYALQENLLYRVVRRTSLSRNQAELSSFQQMGENIHVKKRTQMPHAFTKYGSHSSCSTSGDNPTKKVSGRYGTRRNGFYEES